jgi:hypothetical protein
VTLNEQAPAERQLDEGRGITRGTGSAAESSRPHRRDRATGATTSRPFRPLAGKYVDLIHDGVPDLGDTSGREYDTSVWDALVRTALAAGWAGHTHYQWATDVDRGRLGRQAESAGNRKMRPKPNVNRLLWQAWDRAQQRIGEGRWTTEDRANLIAAVRDFAADATVVLKGNRRAVLAAVAALADKHQHTRPACPLHELEALTGLTRKQVRTALTQLQADGLLTLARRGRGGNDPSQWRASLYQLPTPAALRAHRERDTEPMCPSPHRTDVPSPGTQSVSDSVPPTPAPAQEDPVTLTELARANAEIRQLKNELRAELRAELLAELGLTDQRLAPVRHLRPVTNTAGS